MGPAARRLGPHPGIKRKSSAPARSSAHGYVVGRDGAMQGRYRLRRRRECDGLACGAHRSQAMRPVDTLPGGLGSLKSF